MRGFQMMLLGALAFVGAPGAAAAQDAAPQPAPTVNSWPAPEARQGVAVDAEHFYAVTNSAIGKYRRSDGQKVAAWEGDGVRIAHLNSCSVIAAQLVCANSNFPGVPMASSIEIFDPADLRHIRSIPLGLRAGSLTWLDWHDGHWWAGFANYDGRGGEPGRDHRFTRIARLDANWQEVEAYALPADLLARLAPMSTSGGAWGADGLLYISGHSQTELYVLRLPGEGAVLEWVATIPVPFEGQAWAFSNRAERIVFAIRRPLGQVVEVALPEAGAHPR